MSFTVGPAGIYTLGCEGFALSLIDPVTGQGRLLGKVGGAVGGSISASPDGKTVLYAKRVGEGSDLMMIDNFR